MALTPCCPNILLPAAGTGIRTGDLRLTSRGLPGRVHVAWVDDSSAFVSLDRRDQASQVMQNVKATGLFTLCTYSDWQARQVRGGGRVRRGREGER